MSDSSITTLKRVSVSGNQVEVRLLFESKSYTLAQLAERVQDVEALMELTLHAKNVLNPSPAISGKRGAAITSLIQKRGSSVTGRSRTRRSLFPMRASGTDRWFVSAQSAPAAFARRTTRIRVETVSLHSPLEIVLLVTGGSAAALLPLIKLLPKMIKIKNDWNESRVTRAKSSLDVERLKLERRVVQLCAEELETIDMEKYFVLPDHHPSKKIIKGGVRALSNLDKADVRKS